MPYIIAESDKPTVSVIVPFYGSNVSALVRCVNGLLDQDYPQHRMTIIVIDNNETPTLSPFLFGDRCKLLHEPVPGSYSARNRGIAESVDDLIAFTDSDCVPQRSWISAGVRALQTAA